jgi:hypothetical protein
LINLGQRDEPSGASVRRLRAFPTKNNNGTISYGALPVMGLFAFDTTIKGNELERYLTYDNSTPPLFTLIIVLGKGYWTWINQKWYGVTVDDFDDPGGIFAGFIAGFTNTLVACEATLRGFSPGIYMNPEENFEMRPFT